MKRTLAVALLASTLALGGCATLLDNPQNDLSAAEAGVVTVEALYGSVCTSGSLPSICTASDQAQAASLEQAITSAISTAQTLVSAYSGVTATGTPPTSAQVSSAINSITSAIANFSNFVNTLEAKKSAAMSKLAAQR